MNLPEPTLVALLGPTASGKTSLSLEIARKYNGEVISVDSRQIYRGMDLGTGKVTPEEMGDIPHHLIDIRNPDEDYNVTHFLRDAHIVINDIRARGRFPLLCGGTGFWAQALLTGQTFPNILPNPELRAQLSSLTTEALFSHLQTIDPARAATIDRQNPVRLIRAIEIANTGIKNHELSIKQNSETQSELECKKHDSQFSIHDSTTIIALNPPLEELRAKIKKRLDERFELGMVEEVRQLHDRGLSWERLDSFGLEYRWIARLLQGTVDEPTLREKLFFDIVHYAKRQLTWLRRWERQGTDIHWITRPEEAFDLLKEFERCNFLQRS